MDVNWFKQQQKRAGVTAEDIAQAMGRARSNVSNIYAGKQRMSLEWARAFAQVLDQPLDEVLRHAGTLEPAEAQHLSPGFAEADAVPFIGKGSETHKAAQIAACFGGGQPGVDIWQVRRNSLCLNGILTGDFVLVDTRQSELTKAGDTVIAQHYDWQTGSATMILRRFEPPVLVAASMEPSEQRALVVDGRNVVIQGKVIASWRAA
ncbi:MAG TPA: hypothetical protein DEB47_18350 [Citreicella sp.]|nr:hypothetical protein [Citreicella sp.]